jgi:hypothetical protein
MSRPPKQHEPLQAESEDVPYKKFKLEIRDYIFKQKNPPPDVLKIDVEGGESEVLKGAARLFEEIRPCLLCEVHDALNAEFIQAWLASRNYSSRWMEESERFPRHLVAQARELA